MSSCSTSRRSAEQRCPAERKALVTTSATTCSGSAVESTIIALIPPVSAISGTMARVSSSSSDRAILLAVAVDPVNATPMIRASAVSAAPTSGPPGTRTSASSGTPASREGATARAAIRGVCGAGLATTVLPPTFTETVAVLHAAVGDEVSQTL